MGLKDKLGKYYQDAYIQKYGDRITSVNGTILSIKVIEKSFLIFHKITANLIIKPDAGRKVVKCWYKKASWFKKPKFIDVKQGHKVMVMGIFGEKDSKKENSQEVQITNLLNLTTKVDLIPVDHSQFKKIRQKQSIMRR